MICFGPVVCQAVVDRLAIAPGRDKPFQGAVGKAVAIPRPVAPITVLPTRSPTFSPDARWHRIISRPSWLIALRKLDARQRVASSSVPYPRRTCWLVEHRQARCRFRGRTVQIQVSHGVSYRDLPVFPMEMFSAFEHHCPEGPKRSPRPDSLRSGPTSSTILHQMKVGVKRTRA